MKKVRIVSLLAVIYRTQCISLLEPRPQAIFERVDVKNSHDLNLEIGSQYISILRRRPEEQSLVEVPASSHNAVRAVRVSRRHFAALRSHKKLVSRPKILNGKHAIPDIQWTKIKDLGSEYVGNIGIGTVYGPKGCVAKDPGAEMLKELGLRVNVSSCTQAKEQETLSVVFDTGSTNLWMASVLCSSSPCTDGTRKRYDLYSSDTYRKPEVAKDLHINFGTAELKGPLGVDDFHIGPFTVRNQTFALIQEELGTTFADMPLEGIVGLGFPALAAKNTHPFFESVIEQRVLKKNIFCFYLQPYVEGPSIDGSSSSLLESSSTGAILWGGYDPELFDGELMWFPVSDAFYWAIDLHEFLIGDKKMTITASEDSSAASFLTYPDPSLLSSKQNAKDLLSHAEHSASAKLILDTGTTFYAADGQLYHDIENKLELDDIDRCHFAKFPNITYRLLDMNGKYQDLVIEPEKYLVKNFHSCELGFMKVGPAPSYGPAMIIGELFMQSYFVVFDRGDGQDSNARVGFARTKSNQLASLLSRMPLSSRTAPFGNGLHAHARQQPIERDGREGHAVVRKEVLRDSPASILSNE